MNSLESSPVIVFGGAFNPPTSAHSDIIAASLALPDYKEVWVMPSGDRLDKQMAVSDKQRLDMLGLLKSEIFDEDPRLVISDYELNLPRPNQTYITVGKLATDYSDIDFWFTYGADAYHGMPSWEDGQRLQSELQMVIFGRDDLEIPSRQGIIRLDVESCDGVSSSLVRERISLGLSLDNFVCNSIAKYIDMNQLYK